MQGGPDTFITILGLTGIVLLGGCVMLIGFCWLADKLSGIDPDSRNNTFDDLSDWEGVAAHENEWRSPLRGSGCRSFGVEPLRVSSTADIPNAKGE